MQGRGGSAIDLANAFLSAVTDPDDPDQDNMTFVVMMAKADKKATEVMDLDAMPVLALAEEEGATEPATPAP